MKTLDYLRSHPQTPSGFDQFPAAQLAALATVPVPSFCEF
jgi:hypothetical protein